MTVLRVTIAPVQKGKKGVSLVENKPAKPANRATGGFIIQVCSFRNLRETCEGAIVTALRVTIAPSSRAQA